MDEGVQSTFYADVDGDTYGDGSSSTLSCSQPSGYVSDNSDCNDNNAAVHPGATDVCNSVDDDCNSIVDDHAFTATITPTGTIYYCAAAGVPTTNFCANAGASSYQWFRSGMPINPGLGGTVQCMTTSKKGQFWVYETGPYGCSSTSAITTIQKVRSPSNVVTYTGNLDLCQPPHYANMRAANGTGLTYQWYKGGVPVSGATNRLYQATTAGSYYCVVTNPLGPCTTTSMTVTVSQSCKDALTAPVAESTLQLYPNPNNGQFVVALQTGDDLTSTATIQIVNMIGQVVLDQQVTITDGTLSQEVNLTSDASSGMYMVRVIAGDHVYSGRVLFQQ